MNSPAGAEPRDAVELPPPGEGAPQPQVLVYATGHKPVVQVRAGGQWRTGIVRERLDYPHGTAHRVSLDPGIGRVGSRFHCPFLIDGGLRPAQGTGR